MSRLKIGLLVSGALAIMALSATPAFALFEAEKQLQGQIANSEITKGGEFVYEPGKGIVKCPTKSPTIRWYLQAPKSSSQQYKIEWGSECKALIAGTELAATISPSKLEVKSPGSGAKAYTELLGTNKIATEVKTASCTIIVPGEPSNKELKKTEQENLTGFEELIKVNTTGVTAEKTKNALCPLLASTSAAELKGVEFKLKGQKQT